MVIHVQNKRMLIFTVLFTFLLARNNPINNELFHYGVNLNENKMITNMNVAQDKIHEIQNRNDTLRRFIEEAKISVEHEIENNKEDVIDPVPIEISNAYTYLSNTLDLTSLWHLFTQTKTLEQGEWVSAHWKLDCLACKNHPKCLELKCLLDHVENCNSSENCNGIKRCLQIKQVISYWTKKNVFGIYGEPNMNPKQHAEKHSKCQICDKMFKTEVHRKKHMEIHNSINDFECRVCKKSMTTKSALTKHFETHKLIEVGSCSKCHKCDKMFTSESRAKRHLETHGPSLDVQCPMCEKTYKNNDSLRRHKNKYHVKDL